MENKIESEVIWDLHVLGLPNKYGYRFGCLKNQGYSIWGSTILGFPYFGKLPSRI